mmetsp:Transcript_12841/g.20963  ORF Transcript_12841/g.20963 Transcript_12841/m.20963 type:complete len:101 (-) Transcript_12841:84-386(-)
MNLMYSPPAAISDRTYYHVHGISDRKNKKFTIIPPVNAVASSKVTATRPLLILKIDIEGHEYTSLIHIVRHNEELAAAGIDTQHPYTYDHRRIPPEGWEF